MTRACLQVTIAYVDLGLSRPERRAALLESYHFDINGQARAARRRLAHTVQPHSFPWARTQEMSRFAFSESLDLSLDVLCIWVGKCCGRGNCCGDDFEQALSWRCSLAKAQLAGLCAVDMSGSGAKTMCTLFWKAIHAHQSGHERECWCVAGRQRARAAAHLTGAHEA